MNGPCARLSEITSQYNSAAIFTNSDGSISTCAVLTEVHWRYIALSFILALLLLLPQLPPHGFRNSVLNVLLGTLLYAAFSSVLALFVGILIFTATIYDPEEKSNWIANNVPVLIGLLHKEAWYLVILLPVFMWKQVWGGSRKGEWKFPVVDREVLAAGFGVEVWRGRSWLEGFEE